MTEEDTPAEENKENPPVTPEAAPAPAAEAPAETPAGKSPEETPAAEEPKPGDTPTEESAEDPSEEPEGYTEYSDPALSQVVDIMKGADISVEDANAIFKQAVDAQDLSKVDKAALVEKLGQKQADLVMVLAESYYNKTFSEMKAMKDLVTKEVGGEDSFEAMRTWAWGKADADPEFSKELTEIRGMIETKNPRIVKAAIKELYDMYRADPDTTIPADMQVGDKVASLTGVEPLTRAQYTDLVDKARKDGNYEKVSAQLWARRDAGIKKGI